MGNALGGGRQDEIPVIKVTLDGFWLDACDVTNAQFSKFVAATAYKTVAERPIDWEELKAEVMKHTGESQGASLTRHMLTPMPLNRRITRRGYRRANHPLLVQRRPPCCCSNCSS